MAESPGQDTENDVHNDANPQNEAAKLASAIGDRVRRARQNRRWTLDELAEVAGVSRRLLVSIEGGDANPSVGTLLKIAGALGIGLPAIVEPPTTEALTVVRAGAAPVLWRGEHGGRGSLLVGIDSPAVVELWHWILQPGESHQSDAHVAGAREFLHVLAGEVAVIAGEETSTLGAGDALTFAADRPHRYSNPGNQAAQFTLTVFEPTSGS